MGAASGSWMTSHRCVRHLHRSRTRHTCLRARLRTALRVHRISVRRVHRLCLLTPICRSAVVPCNHTVRLTMEGKSVTAPLVIKMDPRLKTSAAGLQKKFQAETQLAAAMTDTTRALTEANSIRTQIQKLHAESSQTKDAL